MKNFILNGAAYGTVAMKLLSCGFNVSALRPYIGKDDRSYVTMVENGKPKAVEITGNVATLRKEDWIALDEAVLKAARPRLRIVQDVLGAGLRYGIPNGLGKTVLQTEMMSDPGSATVSMDGLREGANDRPLFDITNLPLPITHADFSFSARQIEASRSGGSPLDTAMAEAAGRRVAEELERLTLGVSDTYTFGGGTIYGLTNYSYTISGSVTSPEDSGWTPETLVSEVLQMRQDAQDSYFYGPFALYFSSAWDKYLDEDYKDDSDITLRERLLKIEGISSLRSLDYLTGYASILVQLTSDVIRMVEGLPITTLQWESAGGLLLHFKVMTILVPQIRSDYNHRTGIVYALAS